MADLALDAAQLYRAMPTHAAEPFRTQAHIMRAVLLAFGAIVVFFAVYEVVERLWLRDVDAGSMYVLHLARGLTASLVSALVAGWLMVRIGAPLRATTPSADAWTHGIRPIEEERMAAYLLWFVLLRWIAVIVAAGLTIAVWMAGMISAEAARFLAATIAVLGILNVAYAVLMRRYRWLIRSLLSFQAYADLVILTALLHFSGGVENPLSVAMVFHVILAGIVLGRRECYAVAVSGSVLFALLALGEGAGALKHHTLEVFPHLGDNVASMHGATSTVYILGQAVRQAALLLVVAYFVTTLAERIRYGERQLSVLADRALADRQLLEQALESTGTGLCVLDSELHPFWINNRWGLWFPDAPDAPDARYGDPRAAYQPARQTLDDGESRVTEISAGTGANHGDAPPAFQITTAALRDSTGRVTHAFALAQEITQQKRARARMVRAEKLAAVGEIAGHVAHEVNNPVAIISAKARLLLADRRAEMSDRVSKELTKITDLADRVAQIAQGLLTYSRPSTGTRERLDVRGAIRQALALVEQTAGQTQVQIEDHLTEALPAVCANASEIEQVFLNLFLNALNAMPLGGHLRIFTPAQEPHGDANDVTVVVEDTGVGIPPEIRERVFEPFFTTKAEGRGTGLGLSVCMGIVESHGGEIKIDSGPGGTRVSVTLPTDCTGRRCR